MTIRSEASERQIQAARPELSTWLSANAGSGKTRVLTDRVARLLLDGVEPQHILCLTYTKAAASEMQNRLFRRLGDWAMQPEDSLRDALRHLGVEASLSNADLRHARTLFARAIETPGGLKIQTIHSFCAALLRRFPLEAGVSPLFKEMEDRAAERLREDILDGMVDGGDTEPVLDVARLFTGESLSDLAAQVAGKRHLFESPPDRATLLGTFGLNPDESWDSLQDRVFTGDEAAILADLAKALQAGGPTDNRNAAKLQAIGTPDIAALPVLEGVFLFGSGAKTPFLAKLGSFPTKSVRSSHPDLMARLDPFMQRVEQAREIRLGLSAVDRAMAIGRFGSRFLELYETRKQQLGWLDFDDLILRARHLLSDPSVAEWVLFRLDGGIDHILVDEAQDTSPQQWQVIERLAREFTSGSGARDETRRTIFVVGDKKQSIYSFQGADPAEFDRMKADFAERLQPTDRPLQSLELDFSFRSSPAILRMVDACFENLSNQGFPQDAKHRAFHETMPGRVDLWPVVEPSDAPEDTEWYDPVDQLGERHHTVVLADRIAGEIQRLINEKETIPAKLDPETGTYSRRPVQPGDFLVLVQRRSDLFQEIIRACKARGLPIAGADRLKVGAEMAVRDLAALLAFLSLPEDSLSLATVLRSPLFGWSEQALFDLAHKRDHKFLWRALEDRKEEFSETVSVLEDLRGQTDFLRPYDLIERVLTRHDGRRKLLARLGFEAEDGINALLSQALAYERTEIPSLTGFLSWMVTDDLEIKRQMDSAGNRIRVMTVHGSKGLEAPIVILPDTAPRQPRQDQAVMAVGGHAVLPPPADESPQIIRTIRENAKTAQEQERLRLLYVAMTRAEKWLIVAACGDLGRSGQCWYDMVANGMQALGAEPHDHPGGQGLRYAHGNWDGPLTVAAPPPPVTDAPLDSFFSDPAPQPAPAPATISPSELDGAKALPGEEGLDTEEAKRRGSLLHLLLEHLPDHERPDWPHVATALLQSREDPVSDQERAALIDTVARVLDEATLAPVFAPGSMAEVAISADLGENRMHGVIDRLIVDADRVLAVDFKTNAVVPDTVGAVPLGLMRQMGAYAQALQQLYPDRRVETAILWTQTATLMRLPHESVTAALHAASVP